MRTLKQPGSPAKRKFDSYRGVARSLQFPLRTGVPLLQAATAPLIEAGWNGGTLSFTGGAFSPFRYVLPGPPDNASHVAYFSAPHAPDGVTWIEQANATFGWDNGKPLLHCHATWTEADGVRRGGHILTAETMVTAPTTVHAWGFVEIAIATGLDPETNFPLLQPSGFSIPEAPDIYARLTPNQDLIGAVEHLARTHAMPNATIRGSLGSLIGACFTDGTIVPDDATEVLIRRGRVRDGAAEIDLLAVDAAGHVHDGHLARGENPVCITFDLLLTRDNG